MPCRSGGGGGGGGLGCGGRGLATAWDGMGWEFALAVARCWKTMVRLAICEASGARRH